jgi:acetyl-CoA carboxylase carboxyl transferase subunit alpha
MAITSDKLQELGLIDEVIPEPRGGAHRDLDTASASLKQVLLRRLDEIQSEDIDRLLALRYERVLAYGLYKDQS